ncbi:unnamed protein product, partial [marine sediment metagenome]
MSSVEAVWYNPLTWFSSSEELLESIETPSSGNIYSTNFAKDISVSCYSDKGVLFVEDGQGRKLNFTGISNAYCKPIADGQEIFFEGTSASLSKEAIAPNVIVACNTKDCFDYLDWEVMKQEHNLSGKLQAWDYSTNIINNYTRELSFTLKDKYSLKIGDVFIIDPVYSISNITLDADLDDVTCEGGGRFCHLSTNITEGLYAYYPMDIDNNSAGVVYDWSSRNLDGDMSAVHSEHPFWNSTAGYVGGAYDWDGTGPIAIGDNTDFGSDLCGGSGCSFSFWTYAITGTNVGTIIAKQDVSSNEFFLISQTGGGDLTLKITENGNETSCTNSIVVQDL